MSSYLVIAISIVVAFGMAFGSFLWVVYRDSDLESLKTRKQKWDFKVAAYESNIRDAHEGAVIATERDVRRWKRKRLAAQRKSFFLGYRIQQALQKQGISPSAQERTI